MSARAPLALVNTPSDPERLRACIAATAGRLSAANSPAILVDADARRFGVASLLMQLTEKMQVPVAVLNTAKGIIDETFPYYLGIYLGKAGEPHVHETIENSDCPLAIGYRPIDRVSAVVDQEDHWLVVVSQNGRQLLRRDKRHVDLRRIDHGSVRRSRPSHEQQQQGAEVRRFLPLNMRPA